MIEIDGPPWNTYALPAPNALRVPLCPGAPATAISPESATDLPRLSFAAASEAVSLALAVVALAHPPPGLRNRYAAPAVEVLFGPGWFTPARTVSPYTATELPTLSPPAASVVINWVSVE